MNYHPKNRARSELKKPILILVGIFLFGALALSFFGGVITSAIAPLWQSENWLGSQAAGVIDIFRTKNALIAENAELKERLSSLELERASRFSIPAEGDAFFSILGRRQDVGGIIATVLAKPPQTPYDTIIIDAGSNDGVLVGIRALMPEGPVLGIVSEVSASSAKVRLFTAPGEKTAAVLERHGVPVTIEGLGGGNFKISLPRETEVQVGDRILSAGVSARLLGVVGGVKMEPTDSFKEVIAQSPINIFNVHFILLRP